MNAQVAALPRARSSPADPRRPFDVQLVVYLALLIGFGVVVGHAAGPGPDQGAPQSAKTLLWTAVGAVLFVVGARVDYRWLRTFAVPIYVVLIALLVLTAMFGRELYGAQMSVTVGGLDFQFSELSKVLIVAVLAAYLSTRGAQASAPLTIVMATLIVAAPAFLIYRQPDLGTAAVFVAILVVMLFMSGVSMAWIGLFVAGVAAAAPAALGLMREYQRERLLCFVDPAADPQGACYQLAQALAAVRSGGLAGIGLSVPPPDDARHVPVQTTDFVFTVVAQDLGFAGGALLLALFGLLLWRILVIAWQARDTFGMLIGIGIASVIVFQVTVNIGMVVGVVPVTGMPLPFITYGGSSLVSLLFGMGLVQSVWVRSTPPPR